jgi:acetyl esterase
VHPRARKLVENLSRTTLRRLDAAPERVLRMAFGPPPRSDRGVELDLPTHALLRLMGLTRRGQLHELDPVRARKVAQRDGTLVDLPEASLAERRDFEIDGGERPLRARLYRPRLAGPRPIVVWLHGGGFVIGGLETHRGMCSNLAARSGCVVIAIDYRKAPEHRFPSAVEDALASYCWIREHAEQLGGRPEQLAIGGDSAGGNLSAVVCQRLRDADDAQPALQVLIYPSTDSHHPFPSYQHFGAGLLLTHDMLRWFLGHYLRGPEDRDNPWASPLRAASFEGLAPALIRTAGFDPLRDEGSAYADALRAAGVEVDYRCYERLIHNYIVMGAASSANRAAVEDLGDELRSFFAR